MNLTPKGSEETSADKNTDLANASINLASASITQNATFQRFTQIISVVQSILLIIVSTFGGAWAAFQWNALKIQESANFSISNGKISAEKANLELAKEQLELTLQAQVNVDVTAKQEPSTGGRGHYISVMVSISNNGHRNILLDLEDHCQQDKNSDACKEQQSSLGGEALRPSLEITRVGFDENGHSYNYNFDYVRQQNLFVQSRVLRKGETVKLPFFVRVNNKGYYTVNFWALMPPDDKQAPASDGGSKGPIYWNGSTILVVK